MKCFARLLLALLLTFVGGAETFALGTPPGAAACGCCDVPAAQCPCGPATPTPRCPGAPCTAPEPRQAAGAILEAPSEAAVPRTEARPLDGLRETPRTLAAVSAPITEARGRAPDLGRHMAQLGIFRI